MHKLVLAGLAALGLGVASPAWALLATDGGPGHLISPTNQTGFETLPSFSFPSNKAYIDGGIIVEYVSPPGSGVVYTDYPNTGGRGWYAAGPGAYTSIRMANGSLMDEVQWKAMGSGVIYFGAYLNGALLQPTNHFGAIGGPYRNLGLGNVGSSEVFDEIRLVVTQGTPFDPSAFQGLQMDDLSVHSLDPLAPVPEASIWAMMILGFGVAGGILRRRRQFWPPPEAPISVR